MHDQPYVTMPDRLTRNNFRTTARAVGMVFLAGMVVYIASLASPPMISATA